MKNKMKNETEICPGCNGAGRWETECCNGSGGCTCQGEPVDMGPCNVCGGSGEVPKGKPINIKANLEAIRGFCFIGSGPSTGIWAGQGARMNRV